MFVQRLTKEQLCQFFETNSINMHVSKCMDEDEEHLYASYCPRSMNVNMRLYDFEGSTVTSETKWKKFLYGIFGQEYLNAYSQWLDVRKRYMLNSLIE